jgi:DNA-binding winged helix-turn-helix (wHTH) protein
VSQGVVRFEVCELDLPRRELRRDGEVCPVEPQVFDVLVHLVTHRHRVVTKQELLDEIWGSRFVSESALTSRIKAARRAVGDNGREQRVIRTVHGRGYRFVAPAHDGSVTATPRSAPVLIGRAAQLARLQERFAEAADGARRTVVVSGEAGIGKTTLVEAFVAALDPATARVVRGRCPEPRGASEPYLPLFDALSRLCRGSDAGAVLNVLATAAPSWLAQMPSVVTDELLATVQRRSIGASPERMQRELVDGIEMLAVTRPLILLLDDLHWSDAATVAVVEQLACRRDPAHLLVVGTHRSEGAVDDAFGPVARTLVTRGDAEELALDRLTPAEVEEVIGTLVPGRGPAVADLVHERTAGVPLFVHDLVSTWIDSGAVGTDDDGIWTVSDEADPAPDVPTTAAVLVEHDLARLPEADVEVLEGAAVAGDEFTVETVAAATQRRAEDVEGQCAALARRGLFLRAGDEGFTFLHQLHRHALYERVPPRRRARYHAVVGDHLEAAYGPDVDEHVGELAMHFDRGGDAARAVAYLRRAAEQAIVRGVHADALPYLEAAPHHLDRLPEGEPKLRAELEVELVRAGALIATHGWGSPELEATYRRAADLCGRLGDPPEGAVVAVGLATLEELRGHHQESAALAEPLLDAGPLPLVVETYEVLACSSFHLARFEQALDYALGGLSHHRPDEPNEEYARHGVDCGVLCHGWAAFASWFLGRGDDADRHIEAARTITGGEPYGMATASITSAFFHQYRDEPDEVERWAETAIALATEHGYPFRLAQGQALRGWARGARGEADAVDELRSGREGYAASGAAIELPYYEALLADVLVRMDRPAEALVHVDAALAAIETHDDYYLAPMLRRLQTEATRYLRSGTI